MKSFSSTEYSIFETTDNGYKSIPLKSLNAPGFEHKKSDKSLKWDSPVSPQKTSESNWEYTEKNF